MTSVSEVPYRFRVRSSRSFILAVLFQCTVCVSQDRIYNTSSTIKSSVDWPLDGTGQTWTRLDIPLGYMHGRLSYPNKEIIEQVHQANPILPAVQTVSLWALWPGMDVPQPKDPEQYRRPGGPIISMALTSDFGATELTFRAQIGLQMAKKVCLRPDDAQSHADLKCQDESLVEKPIEYGLKHIGVETEMYPNIYRAGSRHDVYYVPDLKKGLTSFITCSEDEQRPIEPEYNSVAAMCEHIFVVKSLHATARVSYSREHLKDWRAIEEAWTRQLQTFVVQ